MFGLVLSLWSVAAPVELADEPEGETAPVSSTTGTSSEAPPPDPPRHPYRITARIGAPSLLGVQAEYVLPIQEGPGVAIVGSYGLLPPIGDAVPLLHALRGAGRLYGRADGAAFFWSVGVNRVSGRFKPGSALQPSAAAAEPDDENDQEWGRTDANLFVILPETSIGATFDARGFLFGLEFGVGYVATRNMRDAVPQLRLSGGVVPSLSFQFGAGF